MKSSLFLFTIFSTLIGRCFAFQWTRTNLRSIRRTSTGSTSLSLAKDSGIFEYTGSGPPPELAKLFGLKVDEKTVKKQTTKSSSKKKSEGKKPIEKRDVEKVEDLENQLISKYKSSAYKDISDGDDDEWEDPALEEIRKRKLKKQKFEGFNPQGSKVSNKEPIAGKSKSEVEEGDRIVPPRKSLLLGRLTNRVKESTTSLNEVCLLSSFVFLFRIFAKVGLLLSLQYLSQ